MNAQSVSRSGPEALLQLLTLKGHEVDEQVRIIRFVALTLAPSAEKLGVLIQARSPGTVLQHSVTIDAALLATTACLAVVAADIASIPDSSRRRALLERLSETAGRLEVNKRDFLALVPFVPEIEQLLEHVMVSRP